MIPDLVIYGAGGHGRVVADVVRRGGRHRIVGLIDDAVVGGRFELPILGDRSCLGAKLDRRTEVIVAIGDNLTRGQVAALVTGLGFRLATAVHPSAQVGEGVVLGAGTVVMAQAVLNPGTRTGENVIVNTGATVDHDCTLEELVHIAPGVHLAGNVRIGARSTVGIGASVIQGIRIGRGARIGAGAAVVMDIPDDSTAVGVPARVVAKG
jgi:sugar O-acyltransferase (sialic acid O-acetyltransferase NeuD family)